MRKGKILLRGEEARQKLKEGIDLVADYTKITLGPKGRNVALNQYGPLPTRIVNDGVTIANEIKSEDPFVQSGIEMVQEICKKTNFNAGDGTTQTALLTQAIINEANRLIAAGNNPVDVKKGLELDSEKLLKQIGDMSHKVENTDDIRHLATISGNNDKEIGNAVADIMDKVGMNASIIIEKGKTERIRTEAVKGMWFDKGYRLPLFINNPKMTAEYKNPNILIIDSDIRYDDEIIELFKKITDAGLDRIIIIANQIEGEALYSLAKTNRLRVERGEAIYICAIEAPRAGEDRKDIMQDIAIYTGGQVIGGEGRQELDKVNLEEVIGSCEKIIVSSKNTTILKGSGDKEKVKARINEIQGLIDQLDPTEKTIRENLEKRKDTIQSGVGIIYAGGSTEIEIKDRQLRLEDAVLASKSAVKEGFVPGGGFTYLALSRSTGNLIFREALKKVMAQVAENAGKVPEQIVEKAIDKRGGYNALTDEFDDMVEAGVIDATLVLKNALSNAVSLACMYITTEGIIAEYVKEEGNDFNKPRLKKDYDGL